MSLPQNRKELLSLLYRHALESPGARPYWNIPAGEAGAVFVAMCDELRSEGLVEAVNTADASQVHLHLLPAGRAQVEEHRWHAPSGSGGVSVEVASNDHVSTVTIKLNPRRLVDDWKVLVEARLDEEEVEYEEGFYLDRGCPQLTLIQPPGMPEGDAEALGMDVGSKLLDVLERARKAESAARLLQLKQTEKAIQDAKSELRDLIATIERGGDLSTKAASTLAAVTKLGALARWIVA